MKSRVRSTPLRSAASFYTYLKPGALAQLKYSKITAKSKEINGQARMALCQLKPGFADQQPVENRALDYERLPCFSPRVKNGYPRCLQRKKLIAVSPFFSETTQY